VRGEVVRVVRVRKKKKMVDWTFFVILFLLGLNSFISDYHSISKSH